MIQIDDVVKYYEKTGSLRATARELNISHSVVVKCLVTKGVYTNPICEQVNKLINSGMTRDEICEKLGISEGTFYKYVPYTKCSYAIGEKSLNAMRIKKCREQKEIKK